MAIINALKVTKIYQGKQSSAKALDEISLSFSKGEKVLLFGESGSGKSTLLKVLCSLQKPTYGKVEASIKPLYIPSDGYFLTNFSAFGNVYYWLRGKGMKRGEAKKGTYRILEDVGLSSIMRKKVKRLSGGEKNRLAIARAIALKPDAVFFDEVTANLDIEHKKKMIQLIFKELSSSLIIFSTHEKELFEAGCTRSIEIEKGVIKADSSPTYTKIKMNPVNEKKANGLLLGTRIFTKRLSGIVLFAISSIFLGVISSFLSFLVYSYEDEVTSTPDYYYSANFANRLSSGADDTFTNADYVDCGSLITNSSFSISKPSSSGVGHIIVRNTYIQPILPSDDNLIIGKKDATNGFYLCIDENNKINTNIYENYINSDFNLYHISQAELDSPMGISLTFNGVYRIKSSSFFSGPSTFVYLPQESFKRANDYVKDLIVKTCSGEIPPITSSSMTGNKIDLYVDNKKMSYLDNSKAIKLLGNEENLLLSGIVLPSSLEGKEWFLHYMSAVISSSSNIMPIHYTDRFHSGEYALSFPVLQLALTDHNLTSTGYYSNEKSLLADLNAGSLSLRRGNIAITEDSNILYLALFTIAAMSLEFICVFLVLLMVRWNRKMQDKDFSLCTVMGYSSLSLRAFGYLYNVFFMTLSYILVWRFSSFTFKLLSKTSIILFILTLLLTIIPMSTKKKEDKEND